MVKAVHLEPVSNLTLEVFITTLWRFIARRSKPSMVWSDHGANFVSTAWELNDLRRFHRRREMKDSIAYFSAEQGIEWNFIFEHASRFGRLWETAVKSFKHHLRCIIKGVCLTFEELTTTLAQVEICLNLRPLTAMPDSDKGIEVLLPRNFLLGGPLEALPNSPDSFRLIPLLWQWYLW